MYEQTKRFAEATLRYLSERASAGAISSGPEINWTESPNVDVVDGRTGERWQEPSGDLQLEVRLEPQWRAYLGEHADEVRGTPEYTSFVEAMQSDPRVSPCLGTWIGTRRQPHLVRADADHIVTSLITDLLTKTNGPTWNLDEFDGVYKDMYSAFDRATVRYRFLAPLVGFRSDIDNIDLGEGTRIVRLMHEERLRFVHLGRTRPGGENVSHVPHHAIEFAEELERVVGAAPDARSEESPVRSGRRTRFRELMDEVPRALVAYKDGHCSCYESTEYYDDWLIRSGGGGASLPALPPEREGYVLQENDLDAFLRFWGWYRSPGALKRNRRFLRLAAQRLERATERQSDEDRLVELMISAEALFLAGLGHRIQYKGELPYQLAINAAFLLGREGDDRSIIFDHLRSAYDVRSHVVRGSSPSPEAASEARKNAECYVRRALHLLLERAAGQPDGELVDWDEALFVGH